MVYIVSYLDKYGNWTIKKFKLKIKAKKFRNIVPGRNMWKTSA